MTDPQGQIIDRMTDDEVLDILGPSEAARPGRPRRTADAEPAAIIERLSDVQPEVVTWLWPSRIPRGKLTILEGDPGLGKSTLALDLAARVTTGRAMPDGALGASGGVVVMTAEDGLADTVAPRLDAAEADRTKVVAFTGVRLDDLDRPPVIPEDLPGLAAAIDAVQAALVIVDPLVAFLSAGVDSWRDQDVRRALHPFARLAESTGAAVLALRHLTKGGGSQAIYRGGGSIGIVGAARSALLVARDPDQDDLRVLAPVKCNLAKEPPSLTFRLQSTPNGVARIAWGGESPHRANALVTTPVDQEARSDLEGAAAFLSEELRRGPRKSGELEREARKLGISERTLNRARSRLGVRAQKLGDCWWSTLPSLAGTLGTLEDDPIETPDSGRVPRVPTGERGHVAPLAESDRGDAWEPE